MQYMGGKSRISTQIAQVINHALNLGGETFVSLFCGSCAVEAKVKAETKILNDKHPYLIEMWKGLQSGWTPPSIITKEEYYYIKEHKDENKALTGFVGFGCSFRLVANGLVDWQVINEVTIIVLKQNVVYFVTCKVYKMPILLVLIIVKSIFQMERLYIVTHLTLKPLVIR